MHLLDSSVCLEADMNVLRAADFDLTGKVSRRVFVQGIGFVGVGLLTSLFGGCEAIIDAINNRPVRRRLRTGSPEVDADINTYRDAVAAMKALPAGDLRNWNAIAAIHGTTLGGFNFCQHGTAHFFDWHRAYLFYFEQICRKLTGNAKFGLPYWNWNQDPIVHSAFLDPASTLFMARNNTNLSTLPAVGTATLDPIFGDTNFFTFWQQIEGTPHNTVHSFVGQTMGGGGSASDPLFWMHHCMVDYCWAKWNIELGNDNTNDMTWIEQVNSHFVDENGNAASATAGITTLMPLLSYRYESSAIGSSPAEAALMAKAEYQKVEARLRAGAKIAFDIKQRIVITEKAAVSIARPFSATTKAAPQDFARIINTDTAQEHIFASIAFAQLPPTSDFYLRVFLNLPSASSTRPTTDPHYAGTFAFFGTDIPSAQHKLEPSFLVNLTNTIQRLKGAQELRDDTPLSVQLVAVPFSGKFERPDTELVLNQIEIITTPVIIRSKQ